MGVGRETFTVHLPHFYLSLGDEPEGVVDVADGFAVDSVLVSALLSDFDSDFLSDDFASDFESPLDDSDFEPSEAGVLTPFDFA